MKDLRSLSQTLTKRILFFWVMGFLFLGKPESIWASDPTDEVNRTKEEIVKKEEERRDLLRELYRLHLELRKMTKEQVVFENERTRAEQNVFQNRRMVSSLEQKILKQRQKIRKRLQALYKFGEVGPLKILFSQRSPAEIDRSMRYLKVIIDWDYRALQDFGGTVIRLRSRKSRLDRQVAQLKRLQQRVIEKQMELEVAQKDKNQVLSKIDREKLLELARLKTLRAQTSRVEEETQTPESMARWRHIKAMLEQSFFERRGLLPLPIEGQVAQSVGNYSIGEFLFRQKGILIAPAKVSSVRAVHSGKVSFAGNLIGHGSTLILSHGDHYFTVYSGLPTTIHKVGDGVKSKEVLSHTRDPVYFEVRHFSEAKDPREWLSPSVSQ